MLQTVGFPAGGRQINAKANYLRYESSNTSGIDQTIRVRGDGQDMGTYMPGDAIELPSPFSTWEIVPLSPFCTGVIRLGIGRVSSSRLTGVVQVVDEAAAKTSMGRCFLSGTTQANSATYQSVVALRLGAAAAAAGVRLAVKRIYLVSDAAGAVMIGSVSGTGTAVPMVAPSTEGQKLLQGPAPGAVIVAGFAGAQYALTASEGPGWTRNGTIILQASSTFALNMAEPIVVTGTAALVVLGGVVNRQVGAMFEWEELG